MSIDELSMGISGDFEIAIKEGASVVRAGQAISLRERYRIPTIGLRR